MTSSPPPSPEIIVIQDSPTVESPNTVSSSPAVSESPTYASICKFFEMRVEESSDLNDYSDASVDLDDSNHDSHGEHWTPRVRCKISPPILMITVGRSSPPFCLPATLRTLSLHMQLLLHTKIQLRSTFIGAEAKASRITRHSIP